MLSKHEPILSLVHDRSCQVHVRRRHVANDQPGSSRVKIKPVSADAIYGNDQPISALNCHLPVQAVLCIVRSIIDVPPPLGFTVANKSAAANLIDLATTFGAGQLRENMNQFWRWFMMGLVKCKCVHKTTRSK